MIYHVTKPLLKGVIASRDTLDVVRIGRAPDVRTPPRMRAGTFYIIGKCSSHTRTSQFLAVGSVKHDDFPPFEDIKRNWQYASGYLFEPIIGDANKCHCSMVFHTDLDLNQVGIVSRMGRTSERCALSRW
jgi:hypothetical protein